MPEASLIRTLLLPELSLVSFRRIPDSRVIEVVARKVPQVEYCPRCASPRRPATTGAGCGWKDEIRLRGLLVVLIVEEAAPSLPTVRQGFPTEPLDWARKGLPSHQNGTAGR